MNMCIHKAACLHLPMFSMVGLRAPPGAKGTLPVSRAAPVRWSEPQEPPGCMTRSIWILSGSKLTRGFGVSQPILGSGPYSTTISQLTDCLLGGHVTPEPPPPQPPSGKGRCQGADTAWSIPVPRAQQLELWGIPKWASGPHTSLHGLGEGEMICRSLLGPGNGSEHISKAHLHL